ERRRPRLEGPNAACATAVSHCWPRLGGCGTSRRSTMATRPLLALALALTACQPGPSSGSTAPDGTDPESTVAAAGGSDEAIDEAEQPTSPVGQVGPVEQVEPAEPDASAAPKAPVDPLGPVASEISARFANIESDPKPDELTRNSHYWISNEPSQWLWYP